MIHQPASGCGLLEQKLQEFVDDAYAPISSQENVILRVNLRSNIRIINHEGLLQLVLSLCSLLTISWLILLHFVCLFVSLFL